MMRNNDGLNETSFITYINLSGVSCQIFFPFLLNWGQNMVANKG